MTRAPDKRQVPHLFPNGSRIGSDNVVLHASARKHKVEHFPGPLSIKSVIRGQVSWIVEGRNLVVDPDSFLILNDGQKYSMDMDAPRPMETCCAFFQPGFVERVAQDMMPFSIPPASSICADVPANTSRLSHGTSTQTCASALAERMVRHRSKPGSRFLQHVCIQPSVPRSLRRQPFFANSQDRASGRLTDDATLEA